MGTRARRWVITVAAAAALASLAACGGGAASSPSPSASAVPSPGISQLQAAANQEGAVNWYTTFTDTDVAPIVAAFNQEFPNIKVNALRLSAAQIPPRIFTEQKGGEYNADVVSGDSPQVAQLLNGGALQPYDPPDRPSLPAGLKLPDGYQGVVYLVTTVAVWNPTALASAGLTPPKSWQDLTQPQWRGHFSIDPSAVNWYESLVGSMGRTKALALVTALGNNNPQLVESHTQALTQVQSGEPLAAATAYGYLASKTQAKSPSTLAFANFTPLPASLTLIDVVKNAPHLHAAQLFEDWMVSQAGQEAVVKITNHTSIRNDVKNDPAVWNPSKWPPAWGNPDVSAAQYNTDVSDYTKALKAG